MRDKIRHFHKHCTLYILDRPIHTSGIEFLHKTTKKSMSKTIDVVCSGHALGPDLTYIGTL